MPLVVAWLGGCTGQVGGTNPPPGSGSAPSSGGASGTGVGGSSGASATGGVGGTGSGSGATGGAAGSGATGGAVNAGGAAGTGTGGTGAAGLDCSTPKSSAAHLRVLTESQFNHTVKDLLKLDGDFAEGLGLATDDISLEHRASAASQVASRAAASLASWAPCSGNSDACKQQIVEEVGGMAYRRPLSGAERAELTALFDAGIAAKDFTTGVDWFLTGLLQAPDVMYEVVKPSASEQPGQVVPLAPHEYATRLSYFIWDGPPDTALLDAAASGGLTDATQRGAQITRMLADPRFMRGVTQFYAKWLHTSGFGELARDDEDFTQDVVDSLETSLLMSATSIYSSPTPNIAALFSGDSYFLNGVLRDFYGVPGSGADFTATPMTGQSRRGILTHPGLLALKARPAESNPISRGLFVLAEVLCVDVSPPPQDREIPDLPPVQEGVSTRERLSMHTSDPFCGGCHAIIDPPGFALEGFDQVGRFRTVDHGSPVDTSGTFDLGLDIDGVYAKGDEFLVKLADSQDVRSCFAGHYLDFALSHAKSDGADACSLQSIRQSFVGTGDLKQLVVSIVNSDSFALRLAEGIGQ